VIMFRHCMTIFEAAEKVWPSSGRAFLRSVAYN
jgi:hypothetical protein